MQKEGARSLKIREKNPKLRLLGIIALIGLLASFGLHHTALTIAQDFAKGALPGSVVSLFLAFIFFGLEKIEKAVLKNALKEKELINTQNIEKESGSVNYKGKEYSVLQYTEKITLGDTAFKVTLLQARQGDKHIARLTSE